MRLRGSGFGNRRATGLYELYGCKNSDRVGKHAILGANHDVLGLAASGGRRHERWPSSAAPGHSAPPLRGADRCATPQAESQTLLRRHRNLVRCKPWRALPQRAAVGSTGQRNVSNIPWRAARFWKSRAAASIVLRCGTVAATAPAVPLLPLLLAWLPAPPTAATSALILLYLPHCCDPCLPATGGVSPRRRGVPGGAAAHRRGCRPCLRCADT